MISFIVPALNEEENIGPTVESIRAAARDSGLESYEILVVDDGSGDRTGERVAALAEAHPEVSGLRHEVNRGLGSSVRSGIAAARYGSFMVVPGDNDVDPAFLRSVLAYRGQADMILTIPVNKEIRTVLRNVISTLYQTIYLVAFRVFVNYINGPGLWPTEKAREVALKSRRFNIISELNIKLLRSGCSYAEIPGYLRGGQEVRSTVTLKNLSEVVSSFLRLFYEVHVSARAQFAQRPRRIQVAFDRQARDRAAE